MKCPKCGYERQGRDDAFVPPSECPACGIVYSKHEHVKDPNPGSGLAPPPHLRPSPVDAASLKKARERVEKRLRERLESQRGHDERHTQTLKLAKRLTAEQIRLRRQEWEKAHGSAQAEGPVQEATEALNELPSPATVTVSETDCKPVEATESDHTDQPGEEMQTAETGHATPPESTPAPVALDQEDLPPTGLQDDQDQEAGAERPISKPIEQAQTAPPDTDQEAVLLEDIVVVSADQPEPEPQQTLADEAAAPTPEMIIDPEPEMIIDSEPETIIDPEPETIIDPEPETIIDPEPETIIDPEPEPVAEAAYAASKQPDAPPSSRGLARLFTVVAWMILGAGVTGAVLSWATITDVQAALRGTLPGSFGSLPLGLLLGFAYLATGVLGFAFFWVSSLISTQLKDIRSLLMALPIPRPGDES